MTKLQKSLFILFNSFIIISFFAGILHFFWAIISGSEFVQLPYGFSIYIIMFLLFIGYCLIHSFLALQPQKKKIAIILFGGLTCLALVGTHHMLANVRVYQEAKANSSVKLMIALSKKTFWIPFLRRPPASILQKKLAQIVHQ